MDRQRPIVLRASPQLYETQSVLYHGLVLAYITPCPSTMGRRGISSRPRTGSCFLNHLVASEEPQTDIVSLALAKEKKRLHLVTKFT